jgi:bifunctional non-homologous end joining protein LigD
VGLQKYRAKRDFSRTPEPSGRIQRRRGGPKRPSFVVHKHAASRLHYDFRLEHGGVLLSWAVPKGPSLDPAEKRLAVQVEDHPLDYGGFEGVIPEGEYGGGNVIVWDRGAWTARDDVDAGLRKGHLKFELDGEKLRGGWNLVRIGDRPSRDGRARGDGRNWLLIKERDGESRPSREYDVASQEPRSVASGATVEEIGADPAARTWSSGRPARTRKRKRVAARRPSRAAPARTAVAGSRAGAMPGFVEPQLATLVSKAPSSADFVHEIKLDGYRLLAALDRGRVRWTSRNGLDWTPRMASLSPAIAALPCRSALLDGELVALQPDGTTSFPALQKALSERRYGSLAYFAFDLMHLDGRDLRPARLGDRKEALRELLSRNRDRRLRFNEHFEGFGPDFHAQACAARLEGIVCKRLDDPYRSGRTHSWLKVRCGNEQEFVVVGFTEPRGARAALGALMIAYHDEGKLRCAGRVGTGFDDRTLRELHARLAPLRVDRAPCEGAERSRTITWVKPEMVVEVRFTGWTSAGSLRHPVFQGVREDKSPREVVRERPKETAATKRSSGAAASRSRRSTSARATRTRSSRGPAAASRSSPTFPRARSRRSEATAQVAGVRLTHPDRVFYVDAGLTKLDLARYYEWVGERMLPYVAERPLSIVRCPEGHEQDCFFQKHSRGDFPAPVGKIDVRTSEGIEPYLTIDSVPGLVALAQMGALELHPWGSRNDELEKPDTMIFDLDPAPDVPWSRVAQTAQRLRELCGWLELEAFLKTTGGKGLHVVVPLRRTHDWEEVKSFSRSIALVLVRSRPSHYVATASKSRRAGKIFVDYLRNVRGATAIAPYSTRARSGAPVATPISWDELDRGVRPDELDVPGLRERIGPGFRDPWKDYLSARPSITARMRRALDEALSARPRG